MKLPMTKLSPLTLRVGQTTSSRVSFRSHWLELLRYTIPCFSKGKNPVITTHGEITLEKDISVSPSMTRAAQHAAINGGTRSGNIMY